MLLQQSSFLCISSLILFQSHSAHSESQQNKPDLQKSDKISSGSSPQEEAGIPLVKETVFGDNRTSSESSEENGGVVETIPSPPPPPKLDKLPEVERLLEVEKEMLDFLKEYVEKETKQLDELKNNLAHWTNMSALAMSDKEKFLSIYMNCFHLLKRMAFDIQKDIMNLSLYGESFAEELSQWDIYSEDHHSHHLVNYLSTSREEVKLLESLDAHSLLFFLTSNLDLSTPETKQVDILLQALQKPLDFESMIEEHVLVHEIKTFLTSLEDKGQTELHKTLFESALAKYPLSEDKLKSAEPEPIAQAS